MGFLCLMVVCQFCTGATTITITSRQIYALARDDAAPKGLKEINQYKLPGNAVWFTVFLTCLVVLPFPLSEHLFETIVSATTITVHFSYGKYIYIYIICYTTSIADIECIAMVLGCRLLVPTKRKGRFNLGKWSLPINMIGFTWATFAIIAFALPTSWPITGKPITTLYHHVDCIYPLYGL